MLGVQKLNSATELIQRDRVTVTTRYTHTNLDSKHAAVARLEEFGDSLVTACTNMQQRKRNCHQERL